MRPIRANLNQAMTQAMTCLGEVTWRRQKRKLYFARYMRAGIPALSRRDVCAPLCGATLVN
jgi:hypothetical protein